MENLINTKIRILSADHSKAFQEHVFSRGGNWMCGSRKACRLTALYLYVGDDGCVSFGDNEGFFVDHQYREITFDLPEVWDGMGLPPVGTECEYRLNEDGWWFKCEIKYVLSGSNEKETCFIAWCEHLGADQFLSFGSKNYSLYLRPLKTPEQIAAEERVAALKDMNNIVMGSSLNCGVLESLYNAGYRKTEVKK